MSDKSVNFFAHETVVIDEPCTIGDGTKIWHFSHILTGSRIGENCQLGQSVMVGIDVVIGSNCKIQNNVSIHKGVTLEDGVFCGPSCVFTNVLTPRAEVDRSGELLKTYVETGATIGANATVTCGIKIGKYALIGAGAVVTKDVKPYAVMVGNPVKFRRFACKCGELLPSRNWIAVTCERCRAEYKSIDGQVVPMSGD